MIETGKVLQQRYRIDRQIGQGGMGAVYIATDERFGSTVAIKETLFMDDNYRKAIEREARLLNSLKHAALPRVSDHFLEENVQFLVMEYISGEDLFCVLEEHGEPFPVDQVLNWADQLLDALDFLHNQSIPVIHRDIKPQNLKITPRGQIILLDFGLAKGNPTDAGHQTAAKSIFGYSRNYASLEQIQGTGTDPRSDLYSLAATLYHLMTGVPPEDALTRAMSVLSNRPDPLQPANAIRPDVPRGVAGVLQSALDLNAAERPSSAAEMRSMLREYEKYAYLADPVTIAERKQGTDLLAQKTRLMPSNTQHEIGGNTDVKTEILSTYNSEETSVRAAGGMTNPHAGRSSKGRRGLKIAAALAAVLLVCGSAAGLYLYNPAIFGGTEEAIVPVTEPAVAPELNVEAPAQPANTETGSLTAATPEGGNTAGDKSRKDPARLPRSPDQAAIPETGPTTGTDVDLGDIRVEGDKVFIGNVRVDNRGIVPDPEIGPDGLKRPVAPSPNSVPFPGLTPEQFRNLTPRQRRKLVEARRRLLQLQKHRPPTNQPQQP
jgi:serine/threonine protein kinase